MRAVILVACSNSRFKSRIATIAPALERSATPSVTPTPVSNFLLKLMLCSSGPRLHLPEREVDGRDHVYGFSIIHKWLEFPFLQGFDRHLSQDRVAAYNVHLVYRSVLGN